ncbi:broad-complex core protein isoforms 1/2/3/4/5 isoform X2 [Folsomia candida]|uniref:broad-complex core protein isoforms 1/2/3/4/5 isoform X2 n=1 Tax=Folsomia candida TaxID=158441 RepID=UPI000B8F2790|nr:broad-complex core protein isoforms 1/2/3/4/5 isoform X2 [Folsomia candida]
MSFPAEGDHQHHHRIPVAQEGELYSLKWHTFQSHLTSGLKQFLFDGDFLTDVTLVAEGKMIRSHRMLLSLCSPHFKQLFQGNSAQNVNTIVILNNVRYQDLQHVIQFIYNGEVKVSNNYELQGFLQTGELLQIEGLTKTSSKHETEGREPASQQQQGHLSPNAQSTPIPQMHHRRSHIQVPNKGGPGPARSHQIPVTSAGDGSSHPPPTKRTRLLPTATVTSATVAYGEANNVVSSITGDLNSSSLEDGGDGVSGIDPLAVPDLSSIAAMVEHDPLNLMNETGVSQHQHQHGVPGIDDEEQMITIDSIKSESGVEGLYDERDEEEDEEGFEMTDHGDASGLGVDGMYDVKSSGPGPSSAISGGASVGGGANVKPPGPIFYTLTPVPFDSRPAPIPPNPSSNHGYGYEGSELKPVPSFLDLAQQQRLGFIGATTVCGDIGGNYQCGKKLNARKPRKLAETSGPVECHLCGKWSKNKNSLKTHRSLYHRPDKQLKGQGTDTSTT